MNPILASGMDGVIHIVWIEDTDYAGSGTDHDIFYRKRSIVNDKGLDTEKILEVPYQFQENNEWCGPTALAMVLRYYGIPIHNWDIAHDMRLGKDVGTFLGPGNILATNLHDYVQGHYPQFTVILEKYSQLDNQIFNDIKGYLQQGYPVIMALQNPSPSIPSDEKNHIITIVGYDDVGLWIYDNGVLSVDWGISESTSYRINTYVLWNKLKSVLYLGDSTYPHTGTLLIVQGTPSPLGGTMSITSTNTPITCDIYFVNQDSQYTFLDIQGGLTWVWQALDLKMLDEKDALRCFVSVTNHHTDEQTYTVTMDIIGRDGISYYRHTVSEIIESNRVISKVELAYNLNLATALGGSNARSQNYHLLLQLYDEAGNNVDSFSTPEIYYFHSGSMITLNEEQRHLYLHIYDNVGRYVGFNYTTMSPTIEIPNAYYLYLNDTSIAFLPPEITEFTVHIDAQYAEFPQESYNLTINNLEAGTIVDSHVQISTIQQYMTNQYNCTIDLTGEIKTAQHQEEAESSISSTWNVLIIAFALITVLSAFFLLRRRS
jgi:hypothetical protein